MQCFKIKLTRFVTLPVWSIDDQIVVGKFIKSYIQAKNTSFEKLQRTYLYN